MNRSKFITTFLFVAVSFGFGGCSVGPDYERPQIAFEQEYRELEDDVFASHETLVDWWRSFGDAQLNALVEKAVSDNNDIDQALARINVSRALRSQALFDLLPTIQANGGYSKAHVGSGFVQQFNGAAVSSDAFDTEFSRSGFDAFWELDLFGRVRRNVEGRAAETEGAKAELQDVLRIVIAEVALSYFELRGAQAQAAVAGRNAENQKVWADFQQRLIPTRGTDALNVARAIAQYNKTSATVPQFEANALVAIHRLSVLTGQMPAALVDELHTSAPIPKYAGAVSLGKPADLLNRRPDIRIAEERLKATTADIGVAEGDLFPRVTFVGSISLESATPAGLRNRGVEAYNFGPSLSWAAFDIGRVYARIHGAGAAAEEALAAYKQTVLLALEETENGLVRFSTLRDRRRLLMAALAENEIATGLARENYENGTSDFFAVFDTQREQFDTAGQLAVSETQLAITLVAIYKALGGGWQAYDLTVHT